MKKIISIIGTRPEAIKMAPLIHELKSRKGLESKLIVTGQHREMLDQVLKAFSLYPDYDLNIMKPGQSLTEITTNSLQKLLPILILEKPDLVLIHGDTTTTFCGALASFYQQIKIGHIEAGLRTNNKYSPFPEEINRAFVGLVADYHFAPTEHSKENLLKENKPIEKIFVTGNTGIDALKTTISKDFKHPYLEWIGSNRLLLLTVHRRENLGMPMIQIFNAINRILAELDDIRIIFPVHKNPLILNMASKVFGNQSNIKLVEPMEVIDFHNFLNNSYLVISDSGGIQEEAAALGKPLLVLRDTTERPEGLLAGTLKLVGTDENLVYKSILELLQNQDKYRTMSMAKNPFGDGHASKYIVDILIKKLYDE
jgi:UDP-N-acetylglucosamine 2-epimerase (non-hydrolysing)